MRHDKLKQEMNMLLLLLQNKPRTNSELCKLTGLSRRNVYYYLETFETSSEITLNRSILGYNVSPNSKFVKKFLNTLGLSKSYNAEVRKMMDIAEERYIVSEKMALLKKAIGEKRMVKIIGYSSSHSRTVKDRVVEPFMVYDNGIEVRCYEISSKMCKTFRISRMEEVMILDTSWLNEQEHKVMYTDLFGYSSEEITHISLKMGRMAYNTLLDNYAGAVSHTIENTDEEGNNFWVLDTDVCSLEGVSRFILQNIDDVEILQGDGLKEYIQAKIDVFLRKS